MRRTLFTADHDAYRETVREFIAREITPHYDSWEEARLVDRSAWLAAGKMGIVGLAVPEQYGGSGELDYRYRYVVAEEIARTGTTSFGAGLGLQDDVVIPYIADLGTDEQKARWLPGMAAGELICAIAMTEPGTGSDLQGIKTSAVRDGDDWILNGQKTFITSGIHADRHRCSAHRSRSRVAGIQPPRGRTWDGRIHPRSQTPQGGARGSGHSRVVVRQCESPGRQPPGRGGWRPHSSHGAPSP